MKNLFNDISQDEKNRILEMHSGKKNVISEQGALFPKPKEEKKVTPQMLEKVLKKLNYSMETGGSELKFMKKMPEKNKTLSVTFTPDYAIVKTKKVNEPSQVGTKDKIHGMGLAIEPKKFPLLSKPNILQEFERFLMSFEK